MILEGILVTIRSYCSPDLLGADFSRALDTAAGYGSRRYAKLADYSWHVIVASSLGNLLIRSWLRRGLSEGQILVKRSLNQGRRRSDAIDCLGVKLRSQGRSFRVAHFFIIFLFNDVGNEVVSFFILTYGFSDYAHLWLKGSNGGK